MIVQHSQEDQAHTCYSGNNCSYSLCTSQLQIILPTILILVLFLIYDRPCDDSGLPRDEKDLVCHFEQLSQNITDILVSLVLLELRELKCSALKTLGEKRA